MNQVTTTQMFAVCVTMSERSVAIKVRDARSETLKRGLQVGKIVEDTAQLHVSLAWDAGQCPLKGTVTPLKVVVEQGIVRP